MMTSFSPDLESVKALAKPSPAKIVLLVIDGLGGLPHPETGRTEMETAGTPNLDKLAAQSVCGLSDPVCPGITPGSAPGHLALFGYNPLRFTIGRGVLEALGVDFDLKPGDMAARGNFCTIDGAGLVTDRRAGRISTKKCAELCRLLDGETIDGVKVIVSPVREHRFIAVFRGEGLVPDISDSDPHQTGEASLAVTAGSAQAGGAADIANRFISGARKALAGQKPANMILLRGFSCLPQMPTMGEIFKLKPAAVASYPMYRGLAKLMGMAVLETGASIDDEIAALKRGYADYDYFFVHVKGADSAGEDGDFQRKVSIIEEVDRALPGLLEVEPDVIVVAGDHSTPALLKGHSWHPVPVLLRSRYCRPDEVTRFTEAACCRGGLGRLPATQIMLLAMANALKLNKFGA